MNNDTQSQSTTLPPTATADATIQSAAKDITEAVASYYQLLLIASTAPLAIEKLKKELASRDAGIATLRATVNRKATRLDEIARSILNAKDLGFGLAPEANTIDCFAFEIRRLRAELAKVAPKPKTYTMHGALAEIDRNGGKGVRRRDHAVTMRRSQSGYIVNVADGSPINLGLIDCIATDWEVVS